MAGEESWSSFGDHLIIVSDYIYSLHSLISRAKNGEFFEVIENKPLFKSPSEVLDDNLLIAISTAVAVFQRVTVMHRSLLPSWYQWQGSCWPPHTLAHNSSGNTSIDLQQAWTSCQPFVIKNIKKAGAQLLSITFSLPWWYNGMEFT